jgi:type IV fimbrial biogenesis protein FimT
MDFPHDTPEPGRQAHRARAALRAPGFTLIELLTAMAVMAILAALATPSMARLVDSVRLTSASNGFLAAMYHARSEAIKRNGPVALCKSANGLGCAVSGGWEQGWIVFHDTNNNGSADAGELVVHHSQALPEGFKLSGNQNVASYISFTPSGRTRLVSGAFQAGTLTLCKANGAEIGARHIVINNAGRARVEKLSITSCV